MRVLILVAAFLMLRSTPSSAQFSGTIGVFADAQGSFCNLVDSGPGVITFYVVHSLSSIGVTGSRFRARVPACAQLTWMSDTPRFPATTGTSQTGVTVLYGSQCTASPDLVLTMSFFGLGLTPPCCPFLVEHHQGAPLQFPEAFNCSSVPQPIFQVYYSTINGGGLCDCGGIIPVGTVTWGGIKALYRD